MEEKENESKQKEKKTISISLRGVIILAIIIIVLLVICFSALAIVISQNNETKTSKKKNYSITSGEEEDNSSIEVGEEEDNSTITSNTSSSNTTKTVKDVVLYDTVTINDYCTITLQSHKFANKIEPPTPTGYYHYYEASDGNVYFDLQLDITNLNSTAVKQNSLASVKLIFDEKYEYNCFQITEETDEGDFETYPNLYSIDPLKKLKYHFLVEVPTTVQDESKSLKAIIKANGEEFTYTIR